MRSCDVCHEPTPNTAREPNGDLLCGDCREHKAYYASLTPTERIAEEAAIALHVEESDHV